MIGVVWVGYKQLVVSKRLGVSQTGIEVLQGRWAMHVFGIRDDEATASLARALPNSSPAGLWLVLFPLWVKAKLSGSPWLYPRVPEEGSEDIANFVVARTLFFDRIIERRLPEVEQFVVLGSGYDARPYGRFKNPAVAFFEVDQQATQRLKIDSLSKASIDADHVQFVPVDFRVDDVFEKLRDAGYDAAKKTLFLWEGVTLYLSEEDVARTLRSIREHAPEGSVVVADVYATRFLALGNRSLGKKALEWTNEGLRFGLPFEVDYEVTTRDFIQGVGLTLGKTFFMGKASEKGPFMVVVEIEV